MNKESKVSSQDFRKYPDTSHLDELEEELGIAVDQTFLKRQRSELQRIQSERFCLSKSRPLTLSRAAGNYNSMSCRSLPSTPGIREQSTSLKQPPGVNSKGSTFVTLHVNARATQQDSSFLETKPAADDRIGHFDSGKKVLIKGASRVYSDISNGSAIIVHCPCCRAVLQVGKGTINLFCSVCKTISPMDKSLDRASSRFDDEIATTLQKQEYEVAYDRVRAKQAKPCK